MEFLPRYDGPPPKNLFPCLATITIGDSNRSGRRMSNSSFTGKSDDGHDDGGNALKRVISGGGRRKSSFGTGTAGLQSGEERRASLAPGSAGVGGDHNVKGTWYWRVQAGVTDSQLVLLPLSQPPNPILTRAPPPLSEAMPAHSAQPIGGSKTAGSTGAHGTHDMHTTSGDHHEDGLIDKLKNMFRRGSNAESDRRASTTTESTAYNATTESSAGTAATYTEGGEAAAGGVVPNKDGKVDRILDQTARGEQLPTGSANALGATNVNANAETDFPGVLHDGRKCGAIVVGLNNVDKHKIELKGGTTHEGSWVNVPVISHFASMVQGMGEYSLPKTGFLKLEFDKDWIGAKAEAEVLHFNLTDAIMKRSSPAPAKLQLAGGGAHSHPNPGMAEVHASRSQRASFDAAANASQPGFVPSGQHTSTHGVTGTTFGGTGGHHGSSGLTAPPLTGGGGIIAGGTPDVHAVDTSPDASIASGHKVPGPV